MSDIVLDLRGLKCPMPVLRTRKALASMPTGAMIIVHCTDPMAAIDLPHLVRETGDRLVDQCAEKDVLIFRIEKLRRAPSSVRPAPDPPSC